MKKNLVTAILVFVLLPSLLIPILSLNTVNAAPTVFNGLSGYPESTGQIDNIIQVMKDNGLNVYRMSFNPQWLRGPHPYIQSYIQYFLDHSSYTIIVDRNHLYPPTEASASAARSNWGSAKDSIFAVLQAFPNNPRVMVELINEYVSSDFYNRMQSLVNDIRSAGYSNGIVVNKWNQPWTKINDPLDNTYQGYHFYFNSWSVSGAMSQINTALSRGIKLINTEVGADYNEANAFTTSTVNELNSFLRQCSDLGVGSCVWMNSNLNNWSKYRSLGLNLMSGTGTLQLTSSQPSTSSSSTPTPSESSSSTSNPTPTPTSPSSDSEYHRSYSRHSHNHRR